jgi:glycosyltransferase involved in cell wall biosynthesis
MISLVVPTRNRAAQLARCLEHVRELKDPGEPWELIVVDNGSTDGTAQMLRAFAASVAFPVTCAHEPRPGVSRARNTGIARARGDIIVFTDDDCYPAPDFLAQVVQRFREFPPISYLGGRVLLYDRADAPLSTIPYENRVFIERRTWLPQRFGTGNLAVRREVFERIGGFDPMFGPGSLIPSGEDVEFIARMAMAGFDGAYDPRPVVYHHHGRKPNSPTLRRLKRGYEYGAGAFYAKNLLNPTTRGFYLRQWYWFVRGRIERGEFERREIFDLVFELLGAIWYVILRLTRRGDTVPSLPRR